MAVVTENKTTFNVSKSMLFEVVMDFVRKWTTVDAVDRSDILANGSLNIANQTDARMVGFLLMPVWAYQSTAAYLIFISAIGVFLNIIVIVVILNDPLRMTALNWMLLNLACSDGIIAGFGASISALAAFQFDWPFSDGLCVAYAMIMSTAGIGSITTLTALALWRCQLVVYCPAKRSNAFANNNGGRLGHCQAILLLALIWTYSLAVTCPPLFGWGRYDREAAHISCSVNWESKMDNNRLYILYMFAFGLFVPLAVIVGCYLSILRVVNKTKEMRRKTQAAVSGYKHQSQQVITAGTTSGNHFINKNHSQSLDKSHKMSSSDAAEKRVTVMVACMIGAFVTAWTPYSILALVETFIGDASTISNSSNVSSHENTAHYAGRISPGYAIIPSLFAKTSALLNPLIYGLLNTQFRSAWGKFLIRFLGRHHRQPDSVEFSSSCKRRKNWRQLFLCVGRRSPALKPSATIRLSMKQIRFDESQSVYVVPNPQHLVLSPPGSHLVENVEHRLSPRRTSSSSTADAETTFIQQQTIQMRSFKNAGLNQQQEEAPIKFAIVPVAHLPC